MVACGKENQEGTFPAIWPVNPLCKNTEYTLYINTHGSGQPY